MRSSGCRTYIYIVHDSASVESTRGGSLTLAPIIGLSSQICKKKDGFKASLMTRTSDTVRINLQRCRTLGEGLLKLCAHQSPYTGRTHRLFPPPQAASVRRRFKPTATPPSRVTSRGYYRYANPPPLTLPLSHTPMHKQTYSNMLEHSHTHSYTRTNTHTHALTHLHPHTQTFTDTHTHKRTKKRTHANMHVRTHVYCACVCVCLLLNCVVVFKN